MLQLQKKKRTHSGSRSKSKKYKGNEYSVDLRGKEGTKMKTENSCSLNKSRPSRKGSTKPKKHTKSNNKDSKDPISHSVSADRRHSVKINRTEANFETEDIDLVIDQLLMGLRSLSQPPCLNARLLSQYFNEMKRFYSHLDGPFHRLCLQLHSFYVNPMQRFLELVAPMEDSIRKKEQIAKEIDRQIIQNEQLYEKLEPIDIQIFKLKEKIEENRILIEQKRQQKQQKVQQKQSQRKSQPQEPDIEPEREARPQHIGKGFKLDLQNIHKGDHLDYHQQFYSKIGQFSQSWRDQALKQKRF